MDQGTKTVRQCALPGCDELIEVVPGRPERRYCTAAHRASARHARRAATQAEGDRRLAETLPWLREPTVEPAPVRTVVPAPSGPTRPAAGAPPGRRPVPSALRPPLSLLRHRRTLAIIGATAVLAGGYAISAAAVTTETTPTAAPREVSVEQWAGQARVALTALDEQLSTLSRTEQAWKQVQADPSRAMATQPVPVRRLVQRKAMLQQQRATLKSQLDAYQSLRRANDELSLADQQLAQLDEVMAELPPPGQRGADQAAAIAALDEQRDMRARQREAKQEELRMLDDGVEQARRATLPGNPDETRKISGDVLALARGDRPSSPEPTSEPNRPEVLAGGRDSSGDRAKEQVTTSGPPDPRGPRDESTPRSSEDANAPGARGQSEEDSDGGPQGGNRDEGRGGPRGQEAEEDDGGAGPGEVLGGAVQDASDGVKKKIAGGDGPGAPGRDRPEGRPSPEAGPKATDDKGRGAGDIVEAADSPEPEGVVGQTTDTLGGAVDGLTGSGAGNGGAGQDEGKDRKPGGGSGGDGDKAPGSGGEDAGDEQPADGGGSADRAGRDGGGLLDSAPVIGDGGKDRGGQGNDETGQTDENGGGRQGEDRGREVQHGRDGNGAGQDEGSGGQEERSAPEETVAPEERSGSDAPVAPRLVVPDDGDGGQTTPGGGAGLASAIAGPYVESAMGAEAAGPILEQADQQIADEMSRRSGEQGAGSAGGSGSDGPSSGADGSGSDSGDGSSGGGSGGSGSGDDGSGDTGSGSPGGSDSGSGGSGGSGGGSSDSAGGGSSDESTGSGEGESGSGSSDGGSSGGSGGSGSSSTSSEDSLTTGSS